MNLLKPPTSIYKAMGLLLIAFIVLVAASPQQDATASPLATLDIAAVSAPDINCFFDSDCTVTVTDLADTFSLPGAAGLGFLQSRLWPRGEAGTMGAGLHAYLYRIDLRDAAAIVSAACVTTLELDFGPVVPLDYDSDGSLEHVFVITGGGLGSVAPTTVERTGSTITFTFFPWVCAGSAPGNGESSFFFGLASPFGPQDVTAELVDNQDFAISVDARVPAYSNQPTLRMTPHNGPAGQTVRLVGTGYVPGGYKGTIRWDGADDASFDIPDGGAFSIPYTIPGDANEDTHTITVCSGSPCTTGEFEQQAKSPFAVDDFYAEPELVFLPLVQGSQGSSGSPEPFSYVIDDGVSPFQEELPGLEGTTPRPLAAVQSPRGQVSTFVANEIVLQTDDEGALNDLLNRAGGEVLLEIDPSTAGISDLPKMYLIRADLSTADLSTLTGNVNDLMDDTIESSGRFAFSSEAGANLFALAAAEAMEGLNVGVNWVGETGNIPYDSLEAPNGPTMGGTPYVSDAYDWPHFAQGTTQDIGVPEAWSLLHNAGRLSNRVGLAILDGGFYPNADFPGSMTYISVIPFVTDPRNVNGFDGGAPFHGTDVLQTAVARSDDGFGIVGVAAPVADPIAVFTSYDYVVSIASVLAARAAGADIMNMSYSADVPAVFGWTVLPFEATTAAVARSGALLFASAGNDGDNVDGQDCFIVCWEHTWVTPCENAGVRCVGGLGWDSTRKAGGSNYGSESVDIFAPYTVYAGQAPDRTGGGSTAGSVNGTSFASPYAASVAALVWAADPSLSANQVWDIMVDTAHFSRDFRVNRYVNAYEAVMQAVGVGIDASIGSPTDGGVYELNSYINFDATIGYVAARDGIPVTVQWRTELEDRVISERTYDPGAGSHTIYSSPRVNDLIEGTHTIRLRVTAGSVTVEDTVTITVQNSPPIAIIDEPSSGSDFCVGSGITFRGDASDANEPGGLSDSAFSWRSDRDGSLGTGSVRVIGSLSVGTHIITLRVTDPQGAWDEESISVDILGATNPLCSDRAPTAAITAPNDGDSFFVDGEDGGGWYATVTLEGLVDDYEDATGDLVAAWESDVEGPLGSSAVDPATGETSISVRLHVTGCSTTHTITLYVTDTDGNVTPDTIEVIITNLC